MFLRRPSSELPLCQYAANVMRHVTVTINRGKVYEWLHCAVRICILYIVVQYALSLLKISSQDIKTTSSYSFPSSISYHPTRNHDL